MFVTKSESPVVVVLSGSMEPAFQRGDILFLNNQVPALAAAQNKSNTLSLSDQPSTILITLTTSLTITLTTHHHPPHSSPQCRDWPSCWETYVNGIDDPIRVGEVVVFKIKDRDIPIVHRVLKVTDPPPPFPLILDDDS